MKSSFAIALALAALAAVQIYVVSIPHEHPCPPPPLHDCREVALRLQIADMEKQLEAARDGICLVGDDAFTARRGLDAAEEALRACEHRRWLQNGDHGTE